MRARSASLLLAVALPATLALSACGGGTNANASSWVGTYCGSGVGVRTALENANDNLVRQISDRTPQDLIKESLVRSITTAQTAVKTAQTRIDSEGELKVSSGDQIVQAVKDRYAQIADDLQSLATQAGALPTDAAKVDQFTAGIKPISQKLVDLDVQLRNGFEELKKFDGYADLDKAATTSNEIGTDKTCTNFKGQKITYN